jgi:hypothetical protein
MKMIMSIMMMALTSMFTGTNFMQLENCTVFRFTVGSCFNPLETESNEFILLLVSCVA